MRPSHPNPEPRLGVDHVTTQRHEHRVDGLHVQRVERLPEGFTWLPVLLRPHHRRKQAGD